MNKDNRQLFSEEFLNSFVDNQLTAEEKSQAYLEIGQDQELNRQVCELRKTRDLVRLAYQDLPPSPAARPLRNRHGAWGVAASTALIAGVVLGTQIRLQPESVAPVSVASVAESAPTLTVATTRPATPASARPAALAANTPPVNSEPRSFALLNADNDIPPRAPLPAHGVNNKVLIHIADDKTSHLATALDEIESLMRHYRDTRQSAHVEVVINGRGLELVRADVSPFAARLAQLQREFHNLTFAACQNTIDRLKREQNIAVRLLPGVIIIDSGMAEIMRRQNQGWTYLQV